MPKEITVQKAYFDKYQTKKAFFLDIRETDEWNEYHIPNSTHISLESLPKKLKDIPIDQEIVLVCRSGPRSKNGRDLLIEAGFTNVTSMKGGVKEWKDAGYPIVTGP